MQFLTDMKKWLIVGLGNPDKKYINTRHNVGFEIIDTLASFYNIKVNKVRFKALLGEGIIGKNRVILAKPQTYMNLSGESVRDICDYFNILPENIVVLYDDISLDIGKIRIRKSGSAGGHNGMKNIIYHLYTEDFPRVRFGIGTPTGDLADYVLSKFSKSETEKLVEAAKCSPDILELILNGDILKAMNKYN